MPTLRERFTDLFLGDERRKLQELWKLLDNERRKLQEPADPASFGVIDNRGEMYFVMADKVTMTHAGQLLFWRYGTICAAVAENKWERVLKGISMDDIKEAED